VSDPLVYEIKTKKYAISYNNTFLKYCNKGREVILYFACGVPFGVESSDCIWTNSD